MGTMEEAMEGSWRREREREEDFHRNLPFTDRNESHLWLKPVRD